MKNITKLFFAAAFLTAGMASAQTGGVGVGTTTPDASSALDVTSTTKGFLMPRMTTVQRTAIATPATGLQVYDTDTNSQWFYNGTTWVEGTNSTNSLWKQDSADQISLTFPNGKDNILYTTSGLKQKEKSNLLVDKYDGTTNTLTQVAQETINNAYNFNQISSANIVESNPLVAVLGFENSVFIPSTDTRVNKSTFGIFGQTAVLSSNSNAHNTIRGGTFTTAHRGSGIVNTLNGASFSNYLEKNSKADNMYAGYSINSLSTSQTVGNIAGFFNINQIRQYQTGTITNLNGAHIMQLFEANSPTNIGSLFGFRHQPNFSATYSGTISNYYDFYASNNGTFAGTITNKFGIYILGADKKNYLQGNLGLGVTSPIEKLEVVGSIKMVDGNQGVGKVLSSDANGKASWINPSALSGLDGTNDAFSNNLSQTRVELATKSDGVTARIGGEEFVVKDDGKVGIGNDNPIQKLTITAAGDGARILGFMTERPWEFIQKGTASSSSLDLRSISDDKSFRITSGAGLILADFHANDITANLNRVTLVPNSGGVIIGSTNTPTEKLEVNGAIKIGSTSAATPTAGTIRFNTTSSKFEGYNGTAWVEFH